MATGGQGVMWCGYWPISRQHGDVMPSSSHGNKCHELHLYGAPSFTHTNTSCAAGYLRQWSDQLFLRQGNTAWVGGDAWVCGPDWDPHGGHHDLPPAAQEGVAFHPAGDTLLFPPLHPTQCPTSREHGWTHLDGVQLFYWSRQSTSKSRITCVERRGLVNYTSQFLHQHHEKCFILRLGLFVL